MQVELGELASHLHSHEPAFCTCEATRRDTNRLLLADLTLFRSVPFTARLWNAQTSIVVETTLVSRYVKVTGATGRSPRPARHESQRTRNAECDEQSVKETTGGKEERRGRSRIFCTAVAERARLCE